MNQEILVGAMLEVPVACLGEDFEKLIEMLTVNNPEAKTQAFFGTKYGQNKTPKKLAFYDLNKVNRSILLPRNIDRKYFPNALNYHYETSNGRAVGVGYKNNSFRLRPHQQDFFDTTVLPYINNIYNITNIKNNTTPIDILINAECGSGKTAMVLFLASIYGRNALVTVTTKVIGNGFKKTVKDLFPDWTVGWAEDGKEYDITLATYSLLSQKEYDQKFFDKFGHIVFDEYHRAGASSYQIILAKATCIYRTTLTATFRRKDGLHKILQHHIGTILEMPRTSRKARIIPIHTNTKFNEIDFRNVDRTQTKVTSIEDMDLPKEKLAKLHRLEVYTDVCVKNAKSRLELARGMVSDITLDNVQILCGTTLKKLDFAPEDVTFHKLGTVAMAMIDNEIVEMENRNDIILKLITECNQVGRKVLVLSKRKNILYKLYYRLNRYGIPTGIVISEKAKDYKDFCKKMGRTIEENRVHAFHNSEVLLGIDKLAEEGMDVPEYDTVIFIHPQSDIEQAIGRVTRELDGKKYSLGIWLIDKVSPYEKMWDKKGGAKQMFFDLGHTIEKEIDITQFKEMIRNGDI